MNGKIYVGSSKEIESRWQRHIVDLRTGKHHNIKLQRAFCKYGESAFMFEIIEHTSENTLLEREQYYLDTYCDLYNIGKQATGGDNLTSHPNREDIIRKMSEGSKKAKSEWTEEKWIKYKMNITGSKNPNYGNRWDSSQRAKMSARRKGSKTDIETKNKISAASKKMWQNDEYRHKEAERRKGSGNSFYGKHHTITSKEKISSVQKDRFSKMTPAEKKKAIPNIKKISIDGVVFNSAVDAAKSLNILRSTIWYRLHSKNPKFAHYQYID